MGFRVRPYLALAAMLAIPAKSSLATSAVETARVQEREPALETTVALDASQATPESPLAIAGQLVTGDPVVQIQLGSTQSDPRDASLLSVSFEGAPK
jgi:hypothetical protein